MFFDGASRTGPKGKIVTRVEVVLFCQMIMFSPPTFSLKKKPCSNNVVEYNALLIDLQLARQMEVRYLEAYGDSKLIVIQIKGEYEVRHEDPIPYHAAIQLANTFDGLYISHVSRLQNTNADALAALVATLALPADTSYRLTIATRYLFYLKYSLEVSEVHITSTTFKPRDW